MQQCGDCLKIYDESEYTHCPYCDDEDENTDLQSTATCPECDGTGRVECYNCEGSGVDEDTEETCSECSGEGELTCGDCHGEGEISSI